MARHGLWMIPALLRHFEQALRVDRPPRALDFAPLASCLPLKGSVRPPYSKTPQAMISYRRISALVTYQIPIDVDIDGTLDAA